MFYTFSKIIASLHVTLNPFPNKPLFLRVCSTSLLKTLWEKKKTLWEKVKMLVTSIFSTPTMFYTFSKIIASLYVTLNPFPNKPLFLRVCSTSLLKTLWEKEKMLVTSNFSFSNSVFYPFRELSTIFIKFKIVICKLFQFGKV